MKINTKGNEIRVYGSQSYPLFIKKVDTKRQLEEEKSKIENECKLGKYKIIKKIEAINSSNYARIYNKVKYEILFDDIE